jgi:predicted secreted Zn-dependent protease
MAIFSLATKIKLSAHDEATNLFQRTTTRNFKTDLQRVNTLRRLI